MFPELDLYIQTLHNIPQLEVKIMGCPTCAILKVYKDVTP